MYSWQIVTLEVPLPYELREQILRTILHHHELLSGKGYPLGLSGDEISMEMRLTTVADMFDAMASDIRPHRPKMGRPATLALLRKRHLVERQDVDASVVEALEAIPDAELDDLGTATLDVESCHHTMVAHAPRYLAA